MIADPHLQAYTFPRATQRTYMLLVGVCVHLRRSSSSFAMVQSEGKPLESLRYTPLCLILVG